MKTIEAYQTSDGLLFYNDKKAKEHEENLIGELLDDLLPNDDRGNVTRADRHNILMKQLKDTKLKSKITALYETLTFSEE
jgi:hypothetical protein